MNKNLVTIGFFGLLIICAFTYVVFDFLKPEEAIEDENLPEITVLDVSVETTSRSGMGNSPTIQIEDEAAAREIITAYAEKNGLSYDDYPYYLVSRLVANPELQDFVLQYPFHREPNTNPALIDVSSDIRMAGDGVPLYMQWDSRWGYTIYGSDMMGLTGCGPTSLAMVATYLFDDATYNPLYVAQYSMENGYYDYSNNSGTLWSLMTEGATNMGLTVNEVPAEADYLAEALNEGHPVICIMGPGDFTSEGHFIVLTDYNDGYVTVNDPNSYNNSSISWPIETILEQANGIWEYSV